MKYVLKRRRPIDIQPMTFSKEHLLRKNIIEQSVRYIA